MEIYDKILHYPLFSEIRWLKEKYGHYILKSLIREAKIVNDMQPFPSSVMLLVKNTQEKVNDLRNQRWAHLREPEHKIDKKNAELEDITKRLNDAEEMLKILRAQENKWWSMGFAARFADEFCQERGEGNMRNEVLQGFFAKVAEYYRDLEVKPAEKNNSNILRG